MILVIPAIIVLLAILFIVLLSNETHYSGGAESKKSPSHDKPPEPKGYNRQIIKMIGAEKTNLKIMTQNVLAESFTMPSFRHIPEWISSWKNRKTKLIAEYVEHKPDVIGLQELDKCEELLEELNTAMSKIKSKKDGDIVYSSIYASRQEPLVDGTGIFYNKNKIALVEKNIVQYDDGALMKKNDKVGCVAIIAVFEHIDTKKQFIVATTHHYWDPKRLELKHKQIDLLLFEVNKIQQRFPKLPTFIMGDFNFSPTGRDIDIPVNYSPYDTIASKYKSAYAEILGEEPKFTTFYKRGPKYLFDNKNPPRHLWAVDYIFYQNANLTGILEIPTEEKTTEIHWRGIPNTIYGSDHFSLMATFKL